MVSSGMSDEELVRRVLAGDPDAARELYGRHAPRLRTLARRRIRGGVRRKVGDSDLVQDAYRAAFECMEEFEDRGPGSFRRWLDRILDHKARDQVKRFVRAKRSVRREDSRPGSSAAFPPDDAPGPSSLAAGREQARALREAIERMTGDDRLVLALIHERGLSIAEAALAMGRSTEAVRKLYGRVVLRLSEKLRDTGGAT